MSNQTLLHNMRCQINFSGEELGGKKASLLLIQVGYILYLHKMGGGALCGDENI